MRKVILLCVIVSCAAIVFAQGDIKPEIIPVTGNYVVRGGTFKAKIVPVSDKLSKQTRVFVNGKEVKNGVYKATGTKMGTNWYKGYMLVGSDTTQIPFSGSYDVGQPSLSIINVSGDHLYRFVGNKFFITAPGFTDNMLSVECNGAWAKRYGKFWVFMPNDSTARSCNVSVFADIDGKKTLMGQRLFRIHDILLTSRFVYQGKECRTMAGGIVCLSQKNLSSSTTLDVVCPIDYTGSEMKIKCFDVWFADGTQLHCTGNVFTPEVIQKIKKLHDGETFVIASVKAECPGREFSVAPLVAAFWHAE